MFVLQSLLLADGETTWFELHQMQFEAMLVANHSHDNIVRVYAVLLHDAPTANGEASLGDISIVMERAPHGTLADVMDVLFQRGEPQIPALQALVATFHIFSALMSLHRKQVMHRCEACTCFVNVYAAALLLLEQHCACKHMPDLQRSGNSPCCVLQVFERLTHVTSSPCSACACSDLKPHNVLLGADGKAKLADFTWAARSQPGTSTNGAVGTPLMRPPENVDRVGSEYERAGDVYSGGLLAMWMVLGFLPTANAAAASSANTCKVEIAPESYAALEVR